MIFLQAQLLKIHSEWCLYNRVESYWQHCHRIHWPIPCLWWMQWLSCCTCSGPEVALHGESIYLSGKLLAAFPSNPLAGPPLSVVNAMIELLYMFRAWSCFTISPTASSRDETIAKKNIPIDTYTWYKNSFKVIWHVFGFGIGCLENKDIGIFVHFMVIDFIMWYSCHTYYSPISTSWYRQFGTGCIVRNSEWCIFVNYSVFSALFPLTLHVLFEEGILGRPVQKDPVPPVVIWNYHRWKPNSTKKDLCIELSLFTSR